MSKQIRNNKKKDKKYPKIVLGIKSYNNYYYLIKIIYMDERFRTLSYDRNNLKGYNTFCCKNTTKIIKSQIRPSIQDQSDYIFLRGRSEFDFCEDIISKTTLLCIVDALTEWSKDWEGWKKPKIKQDSFNIKKYKLKHPDEKIIVI